MQRILGDAGYKLDINPGQVARRPHPGEGSTPFSRPSDMKPAISMVPPTASRSLPVKISKTRSESVLNTLSDNHHAGGVKTTTALAGMLLILALSGCSSTPIGITPSVERIFFGNTSSSSKSSISLTANDNYHVTANYVFK
ncbi:MAG TPA: hypothetical protein VG815_10885 [Chloroflexota bacterium]|jgi:hypothetical protein|nr:hypothetical protein [Chloroflexota bacterium]